MSNLTVFLAIVVIVAGFAFWLHRAFRVPKSCQQVTPESLGLHSTECSVPAENGKYLATWLLEPKSSVLSDTTIIIVHGWGANKSLMLPLAKPFYDLGVNVCLFDSRNHGNSESDSFSSMPKFASDIESVHRYLSQHHPHQMRSVFLLGHSVGAGAVLLAASRKLPLNGVISIAAFAHPELAMRRFLHKLTNVPALIPLILAYVEWIIGYKFEQIAPMNTVQKVTSALMIVHGNADKTVPIEDGYLIYQQAKKGISQQIRFLEIDGADHDGVEKIELHKQELTDFVLHNRKRSEGQSL